MILGVTVKIELWRAPDTIAVQAFEYGTPKVQPDARIVVEQCHLHVPVAVIELSLFNDFEKTLRRSVARIRFRRWIVRSEAIPIQTQNYESTLLYNPTDFPCRILVGYQPTSTFNGKYDKEFFK